MSPRKIIFFAVAWITAIILIITIIVLSNKKGNPVQAPKELKIWINEWTTNDYLTIIEGFKKYAPEFSSTTITVEKKTTDPVRYRTLLLSMMSDNMSPDIIMLGAGEDDILKSRIEPIPEEYIDINFFEKEYDDVFLSLLTSTGTKNKIKRSLLGVPLGFETMGIFYNKNLVREVPRTWDELDEAYNKWILEWVFVSNLWLWPKYTPNTSDIIGLFLWTAWIRDIVNLPTGNTDIRYYLSFKDIQSYNKSQSEWDIYSPIITLEGKKDELDETKSTTLDMFMQWEIWMIFWYPSLVQELEKSDKRIGSNKSTAWVILAAKTPLKSPTESRKNIARYSYLSVSKWTKNPEASVRFLQYLMTPEAQRLFLEKNSYLIAAQRSFWSAQKNTNISKILNRVSINSFIPDIDEELFVFNYGLKSEFTAFLSDYIDKKNNIDTNNIISSISREITCSTSLYTRVTPIAECEKTQD